MRKTKSFFHSFLFFFGPIIFFAGLIGMFMGLGSFLGYLKFSQLQKMNAKTVGQAPAGKAVLMEGRLVDNPVVSSSHIVLWECSDSAADLWNPINLVPMEWRQDVPMYPSLRIKLEDGVILTERVPILVVEGFTEHSYDCKALKDKSWVTLVGRNTAAGQVRPEYIFVGQRPQAIDYYQEQRSFFLYGLLLLLIGAGFSVVFLIPWMSYMKSANVEPQAMYLPKPKMKRRIRRMG